MDMNERNEKGMDSNASSAPGNGIPVEWQSQFSSAFSCPPAQQPPMLDSFAASGLWASTASQNMALSDVNAMSAARGAGFLAPVPGFLPQGLGHFPVDSGFIELAARSSCFVSDGMMGAGAFGAADQPMSNAFSGASEGLLDHRRKDDNEKAEPELSGNGHEEMPGSEAAGGRCSSKGSDSKKRRRPSEVMGADQVQSSNLPSDSANESVHSKDKGEESSPATATTGKLKGKGAKETSESQKEEYIHVRARRGQATNSHSLAERLRREKISERMKLLQDLVPGCSKVTGKAVMLDEIINYVQSLQRQVEFLSMKLATVNPRLDLNIEGLLSKELLRFPGVPPSSIGFSPEMMHPQLQLSQPGLIQGGGTGMANPDVFRRIIQAQLSAKDGSLMPHTLNGSFSDVTQMAGDLPFLPPPPPLSLSPLLDPAMAAPGPAPAGELLRIDPLELRFPFELKKQVSCSMQLSNLSDDYIAFKVKTTSPKKYSVRPNTGVVLPRSTCDVVVTMQAQREALPDMQCKDKFLVQSVVAPSGVTVKDITGDMFTKESGNKIEEVKLRVTYVAPPQPPSPVPEESEEGSPSRVSESENGDGPAGGFTRALRERIEPQEKSLEAGALISKLTEEKNSAIQQNHKIRQELDMMRREISKRRGGGFSFVIVIIVALIGIFLGYMMKS